MLVLIKFRLKYLIRKPLIFISFYLFIPILAAFLMSFFYIKYKKKIFKKEEHELKNKYKISEKYFFNNSKKYRERCMNSSLYSFQDKYVIECFDGYDYIDIYKVLFIVDHKNYCNKIIDFMEKETKDIIFCSTREKNINLTDYIDIIEINTTNEGYIISSTKLMENHYFSQKIIDPFFVNEYDYDYNYTFKTLEGFFEYLSSLSKLIIELNNKTINQNFKMSFGYNIYPPHSSDVLDSTLYSSIFSFILVFQFSLITYNFSMRIFDEKEKKLDIFIERQGISKFKYKISWLITFYSYSLIAIVCFHF